MHEGNDRTVAADLNVLNFASVSPGEKRVLKLLLCCVVVAVLLLLSYHFFLDLKNACSFLHQVLSCSAFPYCFLNASTPMLLSRHQLQHTPCRHTHTHTHTQCTGVFVVERHVVS